MQQDPRIHGLAERLAGPLPGDAVKAKLAPRPARGRLGVPAPDDARQAAVLMLLVPEDDALHLPMIVRPHVAGDVHSGQIALPGGGREGDESIEATALREAQEELGIDPATVAVLGRLSPQWIPVSGYVVHPIVGTCVERARFQIDPVEVASAFWSPVDALTPDEVVVRETTRDGRSFEMPGWELAQGFLWGATAMMLAELVALLGPRATSDQR